MESLFARFVLFLIAPALELHARKTCGSLDQLRAEVKWLRSREAARMEAADRAATKHALQRNKQGK